MGSHHGCLASNEVVPEENTFKNRVTLLLLGTANSGKSTLLKQMQILHRDGFTDRERRNYIALIVGNLAQSMYAIVDIIRSDISFELDNEEVEVSINNFSFMIQKLFDGSFELSLDIIPIIKKMLNYPVIWKCFRKRRADIVNAEAVEYFFDQIDRISLPGFIPNNADILHTRLPTFGINELHFFYKKRNMTMVDVGGQRTERKKWVHCFEGVTSIIFCVSLLEYSSQVQDSPQTNAMKESLEVFKWVINNVWFQKKSILLFLNKKDIFTKKIKTVPINKYFEAFEGNTSSYEDVLTFIKQLYLSCDCQPNRAIYVHDTCATDTKNVDKTFQVATRSLLESKLLDVGLL